MTCDRREQELLLLAHGELTPFRRFAARAHLRRCPSCQARYARMAQVSSAMANILRAPDSLPWSPTRPVPRPPLSLISGTRVLIVFAALVAVVTCLLVFQAARRPGLSRSAAAHSHMQKGCAPDLPSDQCR